MPESKKHVLLINCSDQKGLISKISYILYKNDLNIISNREFVDTKKNNFYMRTEFIGELTNESDFLRELQQVLPEDAKIQLPSRNKKKIVILAGKEHHCLAELLIRDFYGELNIDIRAVISNHSELEDITNKFRLPFHCIPCNDQDRHRHEERVKEILDEYEFDYMVLAKYMRILTPEFVQRFVNRMINIHHSFLPAFAGSDPYKQAYERGVKIIGATAHFVTAELDQGPIIVQDTKSIDHTYTVEDIKRVGKDIETLTLMKAIRSVTEDRVFINGNKTIIFT